MCGEQVPPMTFGPFFAAVAPTEALLWSLSTVDTETSIANSVNAQGKEIRFFRLLRIIALIHKNCIANPPWLLCNNKVRKWTWKTVTTPSYGMWQYENVDW